MPDLHWTENACDMCSKPMHPNDGAICAKCALGDDGFSEWVRQGWAS